MYCQFLTEIRPANIKYEELSFHLREDGDRPLVLVTVFTLQLSAAVQGPEVVLDGPGIHADDRFATHGGEDPDAGQEDWSCASHGNCIPGPSFVFQQILCCIETAA